MERKPMLVFEPVPFVLNAAFLYPPENGKRFQFLGGIDMQHWEHKV